MIKIPPEIMKTAILNEWVIVTKSTKKEGFSIAHTKIPIPEITLEQICYDVILKQTEGCNNGYYFILTSETDQVLKHRKGITLSMGA